MHIRVVINQLGAAMEAHEIPGSTPQTVTLLSVDNLETYRNKLAAANPDMRYASIGQVAMHAAKRMFSGVEVDSRVWTYNASDCRYEAA